MDSVFFIKYYLFFAFYFFVSYFSMLGIDMLSICKENIKMVYQWLISIVIVLECFFVCILMSNYVCEIVSIKGDVITLILIFVACSCGQIAERSHYIKYYSVLPNQPEKSKG